MSREILENTLKIALMPLACCAGKTSDRIKAPTHRKTKIKIKLCSKILKRLLGFDQTFGLKVTCIMQTSLFFFSNSRPNSKISFPRINLLKLKAQKKKSHHFQPYILYIANKPVTAKAGIFNINIHKSVHSGKIEHFARVRRTHTKN